MTELKKVLNTKLNKKKGFTLAELLVVVAIIAVLVAISIPVFTGALGKAEEAVEVANARSTYAEGMVQYISDKTKTTLSKTYDGKTYAFTYTPGTDAASDKWEIEVSPSGSEKVYNAKITSFDNIVVDGKVGN